MNKETKNILLCGVGKIGYDVASNIKGKKIECLDVRVISKEKEIRQIEKEIQGRVEVVILVAELGCNNENEFALQAVKSAKEMGKTVAALLTTPRLFEGEKAIMRALETAQEIGQIADSSLIINQETFNNPPEEGCSFAELINSLVAVEETIAEGIQNMMTLIAKSDAINIDLEDLKTTLAESGTFTIASGIGAGENRIGHAIEDALSSPLMQTCEMSTARRVLIKVLAPKSSPLIIDEMKAISEFIETLPSRADVKWGVGESDDDDILSVIILASEFDMKLPE